MIISKAPFRISFVGGGSDLPIFYKEYGGAVLSSSINQYIYILLKKRFEKGIRCSYSKTEIVEEASKLEHTLVRSALLEMNINDSLEIVSSAISLRAITVFLSLSISTVAFSPENNFLALFEATKTNSNLLGNLSIQSSAVILAMKCL